MKIKMRGNCKNAEFVVRESNQQQQQQRQQQQEQQQQQQEIIRDEQHPHHSSITPGWVNTDRTVKEEAVEDKNDDSGMSPGDYTSNSTSPMSGGSFSAPNCSLSPESSTSQDSNNIQSNNSDYIPQQMFNECRVPDEFNQHGKTDDSQMAMNVASDAVKSTSDNGDALQCPICGTISLNKLSFSEHLSNHYGNRAEMRDNGNNESTDISVPGPSREGNSQTSPNPGERSEVEESEEPGLRVPRVNSQGRVKTFRCKQCQFIALTKLEFWEHSRRHIKAEKLLTCPKCPFVTEYKHHLEYHLRNHFGSKPFKCDKCSYSCVNKSMLNSHLKSHSNVYQYRCADCCYATKYCHSLKLHLRKYTHLPAMVLNADGSPNPLPIIDIYGTRRGPKNKSKAQKKDGTVRRSNIEQTSTVSGMVTLSPQVSPTNSLATTPNSTIVNPSSSTMTGGGSMVNGIVNNLDVDNQSTIMPYNQTFSGYQLPNNLPVQEPQERLMPLDLSMHMLPCSYENNTMNIQSRRSVTPIKGKGTNRRKGKAYKLDRRLVVSDNETDEETTSQLQHTHEFSRTIENDVRSLEDQMDDRQSEDHSDNHPEDYSEDRPDYHLPSCSRDLVPRYRPTSNGDSLFCYYCEIAFVNVIMYTEHMNYHGYEDPYTCNKCGHKCNDKVAFFLHIGKSKH